MPGRGRVLLAGDAAGLSTRPPPKGSTLRWCRGAYPADDRDRPDIASVAPCDRRACNDEIGVDLRDSVRIQRFLFADPRRIARLVDGAEREGVLRRLILEFVAGHSRIP